MWDVQHKTPNPTSHMLIFNMLNRDICWLTLNTCYMILGCSEIKLYFFIFFFLFLGTVFVSKSIFSEIYVAFNIIDGPT